MSVTRFVELWQELVSVYQELGLFVGDYLLTRDRDEAEVRRRISEAAGIDPPDELVGLYVATDGVVGAGFDYQLAPVEAALSLDSACAVLDYVDSSAENVIDWFPVFSGPGSEYTVVLLTGDHAGCLRQADLQDPELLLPLELDDGYLDVDTVTLSLWVETLIEALREGRLRPVDEEWNFTASKILPWPLYEGSMDGWSFPWNAHLD